MMMLPKACSRRGGGSGGTPATPAARAASRSEVWPWSLLAAVASPSPICISSEMMTNPYLTPRAAHNIHSNVNELACHLSVNRSVILSSLCPLLGNCGHNQAVKPRVPQHSVRIVRHITLAPLSPLTYISLVFRASEATCKKESFFSVVFFSILHTIHHRVSLPIRLCDVRQTDRQLDSLLL